MAASNPSNRPAAGLLIMGKSHTGKTTASNFLTQEYGATAWTTAERIKQIAHALLGQTGNLGELLATVLADEGDLAEATYQLLRYAENYEPEPGKPRRLYQDVGQIIRDLSPRTRFCWEEELYSRIMASNARFIVVDGRAKETHHFFCGQLGFASLRLEAPLEVRKQRMLARDGHAADPATFHHQSETDVDELAFDYVINNASDDHEALYAQLRSLMDELRQRFPRLADPAD